MIESKIYPDRVYLNIKKRTLYTVIAIAKHSETEEEMVVYRETGNRDAQHWARPIQLFREKFEELPV